MDNAIEKLSFREKAGYALGDTASNLYWKTCEFFLLFFYTDVFGIGAGTVATMFLVTRLWDAINDPLMGIISDRTSTRFGKFRPYLIWLALPLAAAGVLCFTTPDLPDGGKIVYAYITYSLMMMIYTAINIPYSALMGVMTSDVKDRASLSSFRFIGAFTGAILVSSFTLDLVELLGGGSATRGWQLTMVLYGVIAAVLFCLAFLTTRERVAPPVGSRSSVKQELADLFANGPWMVMFFLGLLVIVSFWIRGGTTAYYFKYFVGDTLLTGSFLVSGSVASVIGIAATGHLVRKFGKRRLYMGLMALGALLMVPFYFLGPEQIGLIFFLHIVTSLIMGPNAPLVWAMYADTADYSEWKTGRRSTGLVFSAATFAQKAGGALGGWMTGFLLAGFGYQANMVQSSDSIFGILLLMSFIPAGFCAAAAIVVGFYKLDDRFMERVERDLRTRRADSLKSD